MPRKHMRTIATRFANAFRGPSLHEVETEYLNGSVSIADLERRMVEVDCGKFRAF